MNKTLFRYYGGKGVLAPWIVSFFPPHNTYVEPFCGAASVFFRKARCYAEVLNDINNDIVNIFRILRDKDSAKELAMRLELTPYSEHEYHAAYSPCPDDAIEQARRFFVRCAMGFYADSANPQNPCPGFRGDVWRKNGLPSHAWQRLPDNLAWFAERLQGIVIRQMDALKCIEKYDRPDTLFYIDPPYVQSCRTQSAHHQYTHDMSDNEHIALINSLINVKGKVVVSNYDNHIYNKLDSNGWRREERVFFGKKECLWLNF